MVYIHGWGGHGRNGILTALLLHQLYGLGHVEALKYAQKIHDMRGSQQAQAAGGLMSVKNKSPANSKQRAQVTRIIKAASGRNGGARRPSVAARVGGPPPRQKTMINGLKGGGGRDGQQRPVLGARCGHFFFFFLSIFYFFIFLFRRLFLSPWLRLMEVSFRVGSTLRYFMLTMCAILMASHIQKVPE